MNCLNKLSSFKNAFFRRIIPVVAILFLFDIKLSAQTNVGGEINTDVTFKAANNPYFVVQDIIINPGGKLTIEPGVILKFLDGKGISCSGTLVLKGTQGSPVQLGPQNPVGKWRWEGISLSNCSTMLDASGNYVSGTVVSNALIYNARIPLNLAGNTAILIERTTISNALFGVALGDASGNTIRNCTIQDSDYGIYFAGFKKNSHNTIDGNTFTSSNAGVCGIFINNKVSLSQNNIVSGNLVQGFVTGLQCGNTDFSGSSRLLVENNNFVSNTDAMLLYQDSALVRNNTFSLNLNGLRCERSAFDSVYENTFHANTGFALLLSGGSSYNKVLHNNFNQNNGDIRISGGATALSVNNLFNFNTLSESVTHTFLIENTPQAPIQFNNLLPAGKYRTFENLSAEQVDATYNHWGSAREAAIDSLIYDVYDDAARGEVIYKPMSDTLIIDFSPRYSVTGRVLAGGSPAAGSSICLYQSVGKAGYILRDKKTLHDGIFTLRAILDGDYLLMAMPDKMSTPAFVPTYFYNHLSWMDANRIRIDGNTFEVDVDLAPASLLPEGTGSISGFCSSGASRCTELNVLLYDKSAKYLLGWVHVADGGDFSFPNLPFGEYVLAGDKPGVEPFISGLIRITPSVPDVQMVELKCTQLEYKFSLPGQNTAPGQKTISKLSPNPCLEFINFEGEVPEGQANIRLINSQGVVYNFSNLVDFNTTKRLYLGQLPAGIYTVELSSGGVCVFRSKLVKL